MVLWLGKAKALRPLFIVMFLLPCTVFHLLSNMVLNNSSILVILCTDVSQHKGINVTTLAEVNIQIYQVCCLLII